MAKTLVVVGGGPVGCVLALGAAERGFRVVLAEARTRMRGSPHGRLLVELALVKVARLENFAELNSLIQYVGSGGRGLPGGAAKQAPIAPVVKKKLTPDEPSSPQASAPPAPSTTPPLPSVRIESAPMNPVAPVTNIRMMISRTFVGDISGRVGYPGKVVILSWYIG